MELYIKLTDSEYEQFKEFKSNKTKDLSDYSTSDLASALLKAIQSEGGSVDSGYQNDIMRGNCYATLAQIKNENFIIGLTIKKF